MPSEKGRADLREISDESKKAEYALQVRRYDLVIEIMMQALGVHPENSLAYVTIARAYILKRQNHEALAAINEALRLDPGNAYAHLLCGIVLARFRKVREAQEEYLLSLEIDPARAQTHDEYASFLLVRKHDRAAAREHAQRAVALEPAKALYHATLAVTLAASGKITEAGQVYQQALSLDPDDATILRSYGLYLLQYLNRPSEAYEYLSQAVERNPENAYARRDILLAQRLSNWYYRLFWSYACFLRRLGKTGVVLRYAVLLTPFVLRAVLKGAPELAPILEPAFLLTALFDIYVFIAGNALSPLMKEPK